MFYVITSKSDNKITSTVDSYEIQNNNIITDNVHYADLKQWNIFEVIDKDRELFIIGRKHYDGTNITDAPEYVDNVVLKKEFDSLKVENTALKEQLAQTNADMADLINYITGGN